MGLVYALAAYLSWGLLVPVHFRMLGAFSPNHILAERIVWSSLFAGALALALATRKRLHLPLPLRPRHALLAVSAVMIGINWLLYLYAIDRGHLLDASLGYYINPLVSVAFGRIVLGERLRPLQAVAVGIAAAVEEQGAATQEIVRNVGQAAQGTGEVTSNIAGVASAAAETGRAADQVLGAASELSRQSEHLSGEVDRFLSTIRAA